MRARDKENADFVENIDRHGGQEQGKDIGGGGNDGGDNKCHDHYMAAVTAHKRRSEQPHTPECPADYRHLEQQPHEQKQRPQCGHIRLQGNFVGDSGTHLIGSEKAERKGENDTIA